MQDLLLLIISITSFLVLYWIFFGQKRFDKMLHGTESKQDKIEIIDERPKQASTWQKDNPKEHSKNKTEVEKDAK